MLIQEMTEDQLKARVLYLEGVCHNVRGLLSFNSSVDQEVLDHLDIKDRDKTPETFHMISKITLDKATRST